MNKQELLLAIQEFLPKYNEQEFTCSNDTKDYFKLRLALEEREHFEIAFLNNQHKLIETVRLFSGTIDSASVYPREVVKKALELNSSRVILAHNHPSGTRRPSSSDDAITKRLAKALKLIDITVLDHIIVAHDYCYSYSENGNDAISGH